jgi:hypothetical protein
MKNGELVNAARKFKSITYRSAEPGDLGRATADPAEQASRRAPPVLHVFYV